MREHLCNQGCNAYDCENDELDIRFGGWATLLSSHISNHLDDLTPIPHFLMDAKLHTATRDPFRTSPCAPTSPTCRPVHSAYVLPRLRSFNPERWRPYLD